MDRFPGLRRYLQVSGIPTHSVCNPRCDLVYFREAFHDAIELGHQYSVSVVEDGTLPGPSNALPQTVVQPFGYLALVHARCEIAGRHVEECCWSPAGYTTVVAAIVCLLSCTLAARRLVTLCQVA